MGSAYFTKSEFFVRTCFKISRLRTRSMICIIRTKVPMVLYNRKFVLRWQAFTAYRSASSGLRENVLTFDIIWKNVFFYNIINLDMRYRSCLPHLDGNCFFNMSLLYFLFLFYFILILFHLFLFYFIINLMRHRC